MRDFLATKSRRLAPLRVCLSHEEDSPEKNAPSVASSEPPPLLAICDVDLELLEDPQPGKTRASLGLHVCGDGAVRVPEACAALDRSDPDCFVRRTRALLWAGSSAAAFVGEVGPTIAAGHCNAAIASCTKIHVADVSRLLLLSVYDAYVVGLANLESIMHDSPYNGTYPLYMDIGFTSPGLLAMNYRSDSRQHGSACLSQETADALAPSFAENHFVACDDGKSFVEAPKISRGIPFSATAGVHSALDVLDEAVCEVRRLAGRQESDTQACVQCLPFSGFTQHLSPSVDTPTDPTSRTAFRCPEKSSFVTGRAFLPDSTHENDALAREPLFTRPSSTSIATNPFATSYEYVETVMNAAGHLAAICKLACGGCAARLAARVGAWLDGAEEGPEALFLCDALLLVNVVYPASLLVGEQLVDPAVSELLPNAARARGRFVIEELLPADLVTLLRDFWRRAARAWAEGLGALVQLLATNDGGHAVHEETVVAVRDALEATARASVFAREGGEPLAAEDVRAKHLEPVFFCCVATGEGARGGLLGMKPFQFRQLCLLAQASHLPGVLVQAVRNEGGLLLRTSSAADILSKNGQQRSSKAVSPVQSDNDSKAFGNRSDKIATCKVQRMAFDRNAVLLAPALTAIRAPLPLERRSVGLNGMCKKRRLEDQRYKEEMEEEAPTQRQAIDLLETAASNDAWRAAQERLSGPTGGAMAASTPRSEGRG